MAIGQIETLYYPCGCCGTAVKTRWWAERGMFSDYTENVLVGGLGISPFLLGYDGPREPSRRGRKYMMKIPRTSDELQSFVFGIMCGIAILIGSWVFVSYMGDVKWRVVPGAVWRQEQADKHFGCTQRQTDPATGECQ